MRSVSLSKRILCGQETFYEEKMLDITLNALWKICLEYFLKCDDQGENTVHFKDHPVTL